MRLIFLFFDECELSCVCSGHVARVEMLVFLYDIYIYIYKRESGVHVYSVITETHNQL